MLRGSLTPRSKTRIENWRNRRKALLGNVNIVGFQFYADTLAPRLNGHYTNGATTEEGVQH